MPMPATSPAPRLSLTLAQALRRSRGKRRAEDVADTVHVTASQLRRYETGTCPIPEPILVSLALVYGDRSLLDRYHAESPVERARRDWPKAS